MKGFRLYKFEKLCSKKSIDLLFTPGNSKGCIEYPIRAVWRVNKDATSIDEHCLVKFLVNVPKKKLRHAVDRVAMRRKVREAFRLNKHILYDSISDVVPDYLVIEIAFVYMSDKKKSYASVENRMKNILNKVSLSIINEYSAV